MPADENTVMHQGQLLVSSAVVAGLVATQFPRWRDLPVRRVLAPGTVHAIFQLGERYAARFPLQPGAVDEVRRGLVAEAEAARELHDSVRVATPEPVALGDPDEWRPGAA